MEPIKLNNMKDIKQKLNENYFEAKKDKMFCKICKNLDVSEKLLKQNTTKILDTVNELNNCKNCNGLYECKNKVEGHVCYPESDKENIVFSYTPCKYLKANNKLIDSKITASKELELAHIEDIDCSDLKRAETIKWILKFYENYDVSKKMKGLYLHGNFGCGKTFLIAALFNDLRKNKKV